MNELWTDFENDTLINRHKMSKIYKKRYQRASDFHNSLYRIFGMITVVASTIATTISWGKGEEVSENQQLILSTITTISAISAAIQNFYKFQENTNQYTISAKAYAKLQNEIEGIGNIHPEYRNISPYDFFKKIQEDFDKISDNRIEISNCMTKHLYNNKYDDISYLEDKHKEYKLLRDNRIRKRSNEYRRVSEITDHRPIQEQEEEEDQSDQSEEEQVEKLEEKSNV
tara:strand:+ start:792 stop:1475 length:684 start_codon:yes stop_codon:yes gene_type:complete